MRDSDRGTRADGIEEATPLDERASDDRPWWRRDFPIDWSDDEYVARKDLVKFICLTSLAFVAAQVWIALEATLGRRTPALPEMEIATIDELRVGGAKTFTYPEGSTPRLLVRTGPEAFVAYDQQCTHLLCPVVPAVERGRLHCPCHNGWFDLATGRPLAGPPRRALPRVTVEIRDGSVWATGIEEGASS